MNLNLTVFFLEIIYLKKIKGDAYVINFDDYIDVGMHWISLFCRKSEIVFLIVLELNMFLKTFIRNKNIQPNIFREQLNN